MIVGLLAGVFTTGCWLPQLARSFRTGKVDSFSWAYLAAMTTGVALWFAYGVIRADLDIEMPNALSLIAIATLFLLKFRITRRTEMPIEVPEAVAEMPVAEMPVA